MLLYISLTARAVWAVSWIGWRVSLWDGHYLHYTLLTAHSLNTLVIPQCNPSPQICNRTPCAKVQESPQSHYGDNQEGTLLSSVFTVIPVLKTICVKRPPFQIPQNAVFTVMHLSWGTTFFLSLEQSHEPGLTVYAQNTCELLPTPTPPSLPQQNKLLHN